MIYEDPDDVGYFDGPPESWLDRIKRVREDLADIEVPEFDFPMDSLAACNAMLSPDERDYIARAATYAEAGLRRLSEQCRERAGYGGLA